jgi:hypothetical protein
MKRLKREDWFAAASAQHVWAMDRGGPLTMHGADYDRSCRSSCGAPKIAFDALWKEVPDDSAHHLDRAFAAVQLGCEKAGLC